MRSKGFTLIELLAVIVILAIIALIATPVILNIINDTREESNERSFELYKKAIDTAFLHYEMNEGKPPKEFEDIKPYLNFDQNIECDVELHYTNNDLDISIDKSSCKLNGDFMFKNESKPNLNLKCQLIDDADNSDDLSVGDEVKCGETESFYVISNDSSAHQTATGDNITLFAKYNLDVGYVSTYYSVGATTTTLIENPTGIQSERAKGSSGYMPSEGTELYGTIKFSESHYWGEVTDKTFVYNNNSLLYPHVENYKTYLMKLGLDIKEASIPTEPQTTEIGSKRNIAYASFWTGSANGLNLDFPDFYYDNTSIYVFCYGSGSGHTSISNFSSAVFIGLRPVIIIPSSSIDIIK